MARYFATKVPTFNQPKGKFWNGAGYSPAIVEGRREFKPVVAVENGNAVDYFCTCETLESAEIVAATLNKAGR